MSNGYILQNSGNLPPVVPTTFTADDASTATPAANNLNVFSADTSSNNDNGVQTRASGSTMTVQLTNRIQGSVTTAGATTSPIITFVPAVIGTYTVECKVSAYNTTSSLGAGYSVFFAIRFDGVNSNSTGVADIIVNEEGAMSAANVTVTVSGASVLINGLGYAGQTINWSAVGLYTFVGV